MNTNVASLWSSAWQRLLEQAATVGFTTTLSTAFGGDGTAAGGGGEGVTAEDLEGLRQALLAGDQLGLTLDVAPAGEASGWDGATGTIRLAAQLLETGADPARAERALLEQIGRALDARLHGGTEAWGLAGGKTFANLLLGPAAADGAPSLSSAPVIVLQDTAAQDSFAPTSGSLIASDPEAARLRYGLEGASSAGLSLDGVVYDLSQAGAYGTLYLNSSTGQYRFQPKSDWSLNALSASGSDSFQLSVSDGASSSSTTLLVSFNGSHEAPEQYVVSDDGAPALTTEAQSLWEQALTNASQRLAELLTRADRDALLNEVFGRAGTEAATFEANKQALLDTISGTGLRIAVELHSNEGLGGAAAAYAASGHTGSERIYVNADKLNGGQLDLALLTSTLLEEYGHALDQRLNGGVDSLGDEGQLFAARLSGVSLSAEQRALIQAEDDSAMLALAGVAVRVELSSTTATSATDSWTGDSSNETVTFNASNQAQASDSFNAGGGTDTIKIQSASIDLSSVNFTNFEVISINGNNTATFSSSQFGAGLINLGTLDGDGSTNNLIINVVANGSFNASTWSLSGWSSGTDTFTINASSGNETITPNAGTNTSINAGAGNDSISLTSLTSSIGHSIDGGAGLDTLNIGSAAGGTSIDLTGSTLSNLETINFLNTTASTSLLLNSSQLSQFSAINAPSSGTGLHTLKIIGPASGATALNLSSLNLTNWSSSDSVEIYGPSNTAATPFSVTISGSSQADIILPSRIAGTIPAATISYSLTGGGGTDTFFLPVKAQRLSISGTGNAGTIAGMFVINDFTPGATAATGELIRYHKQDITADSLPAAEAGLALSDTPTTTWTLETASTLTHSNGQPIRWWRLQSGRFEFSTSPTTTTPTSALSLTTAGDVAAVVQFINSNAGHIESDAKGNEGSYYYFNARFTVNGAAEDHTYILIQGTGGGAGPGADALWIDLVGVNGVPNTTVSKNALYITQAVTDSTAPTVASVSLSGASGIQNYSLNAGDVVSVTVTMSEAVNVSGTPQLTLVVGSSNRTASYSSGSGSAALVFTYTIQAAETDANGISIAANSLTLAGGSISDLAGNAATLSHAAVADNASFLVDTTAPSVAITAIGGSDSIVSGQASDNLVVGTTDASGSVSIFAGATLLGTTVADGSGNFSYTLTSANLTTLGQGGGQSITASQTDAAGNSGNSSAFSFAVDTVPPTLAISTVSTDGYVNDTEDESSLTIAGTSAGADGRSVSVNVGGTTTTSTIATGGAWSVSLSSAQVKALAEGSVSITANVSDAAGNPATPASASFLYDRSAPTLSSIAYGSNDGNLASGEAISLVASFSEAVTVSGTPTLALNSGGTATYSTGTGTNQLVFTYTPAAGQTSADLATASTNALSGTIRDLAGNPVVASGFDNVNPSGVVAVDSSAPTISSVLISGTDNNLAVGEVITITLNSSENVIVTGTPTYTIDVGGVSRTATYLSGSGSTSLQFQYTIAAGDSDTAGGITAGSAALALSGGSLRDAAGNNLNLTTPAVAAGSNLIAVDGSAPTVSSIAYGSNDGHLALDEAITLVVTFSEVVNVSGTPTIALNSGGTAAYSSGTGTNTLTFIYTPSAGQTSADLATAATGALTGTIRDNAGNAVVASGFNAVNPSGTVVVDTTAPSISAISFSGTGFSSISLTAN